MRYLEQNIHLDVGQQAPRLFAHWRLFQKSFFSQDRSVGPSRIIHHQKINTVHFTTLRMPSAQLQEAFLARNFSMLHNRRFVSEEWESSLYQRTSSPVLWNTSSTINLIVQAIPWVQSIFRSLLWFIRKTSVRSIGQRYFLLESI